MWLEVAGKDGDPIHDVNSLVKKDGDPIHACAADVGCIVCMGVPRKMEIPSILIADICSGGPAAVRCVVPI